MNPRVRISLRIALIVCVILAMQTGSQPVQAAPGDLDPTFAGFGAAGKVITTGVPMDKDFRRGMTLQPDGKLVVAGNTGTGLLVMRYLPNGTLDITFGGDGIATHLTAFPVGASDVAVQDDGKIVVAGFLVGNSSDFMLARLTATGALDTSFGNGGFAITDFDGESDAAYGLLVQPDGKIVACGTATGGGDQDFGAARYNADGSPDTTFGGDGKVTIGFGDWDECRGGIALLEDDDLVLAGIHGESFPETGVDFALARLNADGTLDTSFDVDGKLTTGFGGNEGAYAVAMQPDGKMVAAGDDYWGGYVRVARYLPNGELDDSFDGDGKLSIDVQTNVWIRDLAIQPDGKLVLLGYQNGQVAFYRLNPDSSLDTTFDGDGSLTLDFGGDDRGYALALQTDGRIVAYGARGNDHALVRLWPDGSLDTGGQQVLDFADAFLDPNSSETVYGLAVQPDGKLVAVGDIASAGATDRNFALARFLPDGRPDTTFGSWGQVSFGFGGLEVARAVALQGDGKIVAAGSIGSGSSANFMLARFNMDGTPDSTFGFLGFTALDFLGEEDYGTAVALAPDGKVVVVGTSRRAGSSFLSVARLDSNGTTDSTFSQDGKMTLQSDPGTNQLANAVIVQADRKIVVAGSQDGTPNNHFALVRFNEDGTLDATFGNGGTTITNMGGFATILTLAATADEGFVAAGVVSYHGNSDFALARYTADGLLDTAFGTGGKAFVEFGDLDAALAVDVRGDGVIAVAGHAGALMAVAQLRPDGTLDLAFHGIGQVTTDFVGDKEWAYGVQFVAPDKIAIAGYQTVNGHTNMALARFETTRQPTADLAQQLFVPLVVR